LRVSELILKEAVVLGMEALQKGRLPQQVGQALRVSAIPVMADQADCYHRVGGFPQLRGSFLGLNQNHRLLLVGHPLPQGLAEMMPFGALSSCPLLQGRESNRALAAEEEEFIDL